MQGLMHALFSQWASMSYCHAKAKPDKLLLCYVEYHAVLLAQGGVSTRGSVDWSSFDGAISPVWSGQWRAVTRYSDIRKSMVRIIVACPKRRWQQQGRLAEWRDEGRGQMDFDQRVNSTGRRRGGLRFASVCLRGGQLRSTRAEGETRTPTQTPVLGRRLGKSDIRGERRIDGFWQLQDESCRGEYPRSRPLDPSPLPPVVWRALPGLSLYGGEEHTRNVTYNGRPFLRSEPPSCSERAMLCTLYYYGALLHAQAARTCNTVVRPLICLAVRVLLRAYVTRVASLLVAHTTVSELPSRALFICVTALAHFGHACTQLCTQLHNSSAAERVESTRRADLGSCLPCSCEDDDVEAGCTSTHLIARTD
ncbi:uncharacterized protein V1518DRAFT_310796 [Limtongia smithiae]|uniref:uncharacterized protein n=1 Tax=Limtongia smithiae TaxID=1125753 RepID=UPI0034CFB480